jgi:uncharacterized membrane protein YidH (DUF202 family)
VTRPDPTLVVLLILVGVSALATATWLALREVPAERGRRARAVSPVVPWLGSGLAVVLAVRGALPAAGIVLLATLVHAAVARWRAVAPRRRR